MIIFTDCDEVSGAGWYRTSVLDTFIVRPNLLAAHAKLDDIPAAWQQDNKALNELQTLQLVENKGTSRRCWEWDAYCVPGRQK